ncbi:MAG: hypothetical protein IJ542_02585 [Clostridia bacterium]|nr:hypothetical protein [Clostridia bacterium]
MKTKEFFFWLIIICCGLLACFWLFQNINRSGYNYGDFASNYSDNLRFNLYQDSVLLSPSATDSNKYEYSSKFSSAFQVDPNFNAEEKEYLLELNGECFATTNIHHGVAELELDFTFLNTHGEEILTDTLHMELNFMLGSTQLEMWTDGGYDAVRCWNYFFDSMHFNLRVYEVGEKDILPTSVNTPTRVTLNNDMTTSAQAVS